MRPQDSHSFPHTDSRRAAPRSALRLRIVLLATSALVSAALSTTVAHAGNATWRADPADGDFNNAANWIGAAIPSGTATATFGTSAVGDVSFKQSTQLGGITVNPNAGNYTFTNKAGLTLTFNGAGLSVGSGSSLQLFNNGNTYFVGGSTAAQSVITNHGFLTFQETSTAGNARILSSGGSIGFYDQANGGTARIVLDNGALDISATSDGTMVGSIEGSGRVFLGDTNLAVGGNNLHTTFSGVIQDGNPSGNGGTGGSLTKEAPVPSPSPASTPIPARPPSVAASWSSTDRSKNRAA